MPCNKFDYVDSKYILKKIKRLRNQLTQILDNVYVIIPGCRVDIYLKTYLMALDVRAMKWEGILYVVGL